MLVHQVEIYVEHDGHLRIAPDVSDSLEQGRGRGAAGQAALSCQLVDQSVGKRVAKGYAQFQHINPRLVQRQRQLAGVFKIRIARANVGHKALLAGGLQVRETLLNAVHPLVVCQLLGSEAIRSPSSVKSGRTAVISGIPFARSFAWPPVAITGR